METLNNGDYSRDSLAHPRRKKFLHKFLEIAAHQKEINRLRDEIIGMVLLDKRDGENRGGE